MMMIVNIDDISSSIADIDDELDKLGKEIGVVIKCQREEIFDMMHRI